MRAVTSGAPGLNIRLIAEGEVVPGLFLGRREYDITPDLVQTYIAGTGDDHPWYTGSSPFGGPVAPALLRHSEVYSYPGWYLRNVYGNLHAKQEFELFHPILVGERVVSAAQIVDRYVKRNRDYVVNEATLYGLDGRILMRGRTHQSFLRDANVGGVVVDKERERSGERRFDIDPAGALEEIPPVEKTITDEMCMAFSGPERNYHNDRDAARALGFPDIVVQGMMTICFLSEMMTRRYGQGWFCGGKLQVSLVNVVWGGDTITARGLVREIEPVGSRRRARCEVWAEKPDGTKVVIGTASALLS